MGIRIFDPDGDSGDKNGVVIEIDVVVEAVMSTTSGDLGGIALRARRSMQEHIRSPWTVARALPMVKATPKAIDNARPL